MSEELDEEKAKWDLFPEKLYGEIVGKDGEDGVEVLAHTSPEKAAEDACDGEEFILGEYKLVGTVRVTARLEVTVEER